VEGVLFASMLSGKVVFTRNVILVFT